MIRRKTVWLSTPMKIVADTHIPFLKACLSGRRSRLPGQGVPFVEKNRSRCGCPHRPNPNLLRQRLAGRQLRTVHRHPVLGYDHIDLDYCDGQKYKPGERPWLQRQSRGSIRHLITPGAGQKITV